MLRNIYIYIYLPKYMCVGIHVTFTSFLLSCLLLTDFCGVNTLPVADFSLPAVQQLACKSPEHLTISSQSHGLI